MRKLFEKLETGISLHQPFTINWTLQDCGFGQFHFYEKHGVICCDNEFMKKETIKQILCAMVDQCVLTDVKE